MGRLPVRFSDYAFDANNDINPHEGSMLLDPVHRRAYVEETFNNQLALYFHRFDLDAVEGGSAEELLPPITITQDVQAHLVSSDAPKPAGHEPVMTIDPAGSRIFYWAQGLVYEVKTDSDPANPTVHGWVYSASGLDSVRPGSDATVYTGVNQIVRGISYDAGGEGPTGTRYPQRLYTVSEALQAGVTGAVLMGWDASPGQRDWRHAESRGKWTYVSRTCASLQRGGVNIQSPVFRMGDWLYTFCDALNDGASKGVMRVKLSVGAEGSPEPDPQTEQILPGIAGVGAHVHADPVSQRIYVANTTGNDLTGSTSRNVTVFDANANEGHGAYIGELALSQSAAATQEGLDPITGRWYIHTVGGLWSQDGRLRRVAQAKLFATATDGTDLSGPTVTSKPIVVDPAAVDSGGHVVRPARLFVPRVDDQCPAIPSTVGPQQAKVCYEVYEDTTPLVDPEAAVPDENTQDVPEGPGKTGLYDGITSAYGLRVRAMRGLSSTWTSSIPGAGTAAQPLERVPKHTPPEGPDDYVADPFFYHAGACGSNDRELTFGRVRQATVHGDLSLKDANAVALPVDPDVIRPSAPDDTQTRDDVESPDNGCAARLLRTMANPMQIPDQFWDGVGQVLHGTSQTWPYARAECLGDEPKSTGGSFQGVAPATAEVKCAGTADEPSVSTATHTQLNPGESVVSVVETETSTQSRRLPGRGIESTARAVVRGIDVAGQVQIDKMVVAATTRAKGYCKSAQSDCRKGLDPAAETPPQTETTREFFGLTVAGQRRCDFCDPQQVVDAINKVLAPVGYARAANPEPDVTQGRVKGTMAVVQKDLLLQDSDAVTNNDFSTEWPGLEIVMYRDGQTRGRGRWEVQLGGVFSQTQFGVVDELKESPPENFGSGGETTTPGTTVPAQEILGTPDSAGEQILLTGGEVNLNTAKAESAVPTAPEEGPIQKIIKGFERTLKGALLLLMVWGLVYAPIYLARRRQFLREVMSRS